MSTRPTAFEEMSRFWQRNRELKRPLSPHITVYRYNVTMLISITNRVLGVALSGGLCLGAISMLCLPKDYTYYMRQLRDMSLGPAIIYSAKFVIALPFAFHLVAGARHLLWDLGYGYSKPASFQGSIAVLGLTALLTAFLMFGVKPSSTLL